MNKGGSWNELVRPGWPAGWVGWNGVVGADLDNDGDIDYVVTNGGLNTRYQPSTEEPCRIYYGDFNGDGNPQIVEAVMTRAGGLPLRAKSALEKADPRLGHSIPDTSRICRRRIVGYFLHYGLGRRL